VTPLRRPFFWSSANRAETIMRFPRSESSRSTKQSLTIAIAAAALTAFSFTALAQVVPAQPAPQVGAAADPSAPHYTDDQLDQLVSPIALYPDPLVAEILPAASFPVEVVAAQQWANQNPGQIGNDAAIQAQSWDDPVKALAHYPTVLKYLADNIQYTQELGTAFINQQQDVTNAIQRQRAKAAALGNLVTTPQQTVQNDSGVIYVEPTNPQTIYVPTYDPNAIYDQTLSSPFYWGSGYGVGAWFDLDFDWGGHDIVRGRRDWDGKTWHWEAPRGVGHPIGGPIHGPPHAVPGGFHPEPYARPVGRPSPIPVGGFARPEPVDRGRYAPTPEPRGAFDYQPRVDVQHEVGRVVPAPVHVAPVAPRVINVPHDAPVVHEAPAPGGIIRGAPTPPMVHAEPSGPMGGGGGHPGGGGGGGGHR
jgi:hypothetical protein